MILNRYSYAEDNPVSFNDPSGNMRAYFGGASPFSPHPHPSHSRPSPSKPATPPPRRTNPFVQSGTSTPSKGPGYWDWLERQPLLLGAFIVTVAGDVATILDPFLHGIFQTVAQTISAGGGLLSDFQSLYQAFVQKDLASAVGLLTTFAWDLTTAIIVKANWIQKSLITAGLAAVGLADIPSEGGVSEALALVGGFQLATDITWFFTTSYVQWDNLS